MESCLYWTNVERSLSPDFAVVTTSVLQLLGFHDNLRLHFLKYFCFLISGSSSFVAFKSSHVCGHDLIDLVHFDNGSGSRYWIFANNQQRSGSLVVP